MDMAQLPVTLVIKAPNQRIGDHTVECMLGWTVKKLKRHLEEVYPSKPKETHQKLIYSGKLLQDHLLLKDIIRRDIDQTHHTVHLVCLQHESQEMNTPSSVSTATPTVNTIPNTEGLRYRGNNNVNIQPNNPFESMPNTPQPPMSPTGMTQEQYMMMMQAYYNQMAAQYMQYYQTGAFPNMANVNMAMPGLPNQTPAPQAPQQNVQNQPRDNDNVILDARGRVVDNVDNDDEFQNDWLDYVYTFSRFMVLISIVYFYSNFTRFAIVALFFFIVYLYQTGFFRVRRREPVNQPQVVAEQPQAQPQENVAEERNQENDSDTSTEASENVTPPEPPKPSALSVAWSFFTTFFSSLIPSPPPAVNNN